MSKKIVIDGVEIAGSDGRSAYDVWLDAGNVGTEADFLASLKGDTGVSADYPITIYNGLDSTATDEALSAYQGKALDTKISQLGQEIELLPLKWIDNAYIDKDTGAVTPYPLGGFSASELILIRDGFSYFLDGYPSTGSITDAVAFYREDGTTFISGIQAEYHTIYEHVPVVIPSNASYMRLGKDSRGDFNLLISNAAMYEFEGLQNRVSVIEDNENALLPYQPVWLDGGNYIDKTNGNVVPTDLAFKTSDKLELIDGCKIKINGIIRGSAIYGVAFYNSSDVCLGGLENETYTDYEIPIPSSASYVRFCNSSSDIEGFDVFISRDLLLSVFDEKIKSINKDIHSIEDELSAVSDYDTDYLKNRIIGELWDSTTCLDQGNYTVNGVYFNATRKFKKLTCGCGRTNSLDVKIVDLGTMEIIETITKNGTAGTDIVVIPEDFQFDFDSNTLTIGIFIENHNLGSEVSKRVVPFKSSTNNDLLKFDDGSTNLTEMSYKAAMQFEIEEQLPIIREIESIKGCNTDDYDLQTYINKHRDVILQAGTYYVDVPLTIPDGTKITGVRGSTIIKLRNAEHCINLLGKTDISIENITFEGMTSVSPASITLSNIKTRVGEGTEVGIYINGETKSVFINNCRFKNFDLAGVRLYRSHGYLKEEVKITDCIFNNNWYGLLFDVRSEYNTVQGCSFNDNEIGCFIAGGNNYLSCCHLDRNAVGCVISGTLGENDSHGVIGTTSFNHNTVYSVCCIDVNNGFCFSGFSIFDGDIAIDNSKGLLFNGGSIAAGIEQTNPAASQVSMVANCMFFKTYHGGTISDTTRLALKNNHFVDGSDPSSINN